MNLSEGMFNPNMGRQRTDPRVVSRVVSDDTLHPQYDIIYGVREIGQPRFGKLDCG